MRASTLIERVPLKNGVFIISKSSFTISGKHLSAPLVTNINSELRFCLYEVSIPGVILRFRNLNAFLKKREPVRLKVVMDPLFSTGYRPENKYSIRRLAPASRSTDF